MPERSENRQQSSVGNQSAPPHRQFFTVDTGMPTGASGSITMSRSDESRNPPMEYRQQSSVAPPASRARRDGDGGGRPGDEESYDDFSAKVREEMRRVQADMRGTIGAAGHHPWKAFHSQQTNGPPPPHGGSGGGDVGHVPRKVAHPHPPSGSLPSRANSNDRRPGSASNMATSNETQADRYRDDPIQRERSRPGHHYNDSKATQTNLLHEIQNNENDKRRGGDDYHRVIERIKSLERELAAKDNEIVSLHGERIGGEQDHRQLLERNKHLEEWNGELEQKLAKKDAAIDELTRQLQSMEGRIQSVEQDAQTAKDALSSEKDRLAQDYARDLDVLESEYEQALVGAVRENEVLQKDLASAQEMFESAQGMINKLRDQNDMLASDNEELRKETIKLEKEKAEELQDQNEEMHKMRNDNDILRDENEKLKEMVDLAQEDVEHRLRAIKELEVDYEEAVKERNHLKTAVTDLKEFEEKYETLVKEKIDFERAAEDVKKLRWECDEVTKDKTRLEKMVEDKKENYHHLLEEKIRHERVNQDLQDEMYRLREGYDVMKARLSLLDEMTDALEQALDEKQDALVQKGNAIVDYNKLQDEYAALQRTLESTEESMKREANADKESLRREVNAALARKDEAVAQYKDLVKDHTALTKEHAKLQSTKDTAAHVTEMVTRQRDKMSGMVKKYQDEIAELKRANRDLQAQRDDLKEELICVLETASCYGD